MRILTAIGGMSATKGPTRHKMRLKELSGRVPTVGKRNPSALQHHQVGKRNLCHQAYLLRPIQGKYSQRCLSQKTRTNGVKFNTWFSRVTRFYQLDGTAVGREAEIANTMYVW